MVLIPAMSLWLHQYNGELADLTLSQGSVLLMLLGSIFNAVARNLWTFAAGFVLAVLGGGITVTLRAYISAKVDSQSSNRLYATIATFEVVGGLLGLPIMGAAYSWTISHQDNSLALPWLVSGVRYERYTIS